MRRSLLFLKSGMAVCLLLYMYTGCVKTDVNTIKYSLPKVQDKAASMDKAGSITNDSEKEEIVNLTYAGWGTENEKNVTQKTLDSFNENHENIKVSYMHIPTDYTTKMATLAAANQLPDVFMFYKDASLKWGKLGNLYNLKEFMDNDQDVVESKLIPNALLKLSEDMVIGTKICEEVFANYYNVDMFREAGVEMPPATSEGAWEWDKFVEIAKKMTIDNNGNNALSPNFDPENIKQYGVRFNRWMWSLFFDSNQTSIVSEDKSKLNLTDPAVIEAVQKLADLINVHHVAPSLTAEKNLPNPAVALQSRRIAMDLDGQWVNVDLGATGMNFDVGVLPKMKRPSCVQYGEAIVMSAQTQHKDEAWVLLKWIIDPETSVDIYSSGLWMPTVMDWYTNPELINKWATVRPGHSAGYKTAVLDPLLEYGTNNHGYWLVNAEDINLIITPALDDVWLGMKSAAEVFGELEPELAEIYQGVYN